MLPFMTSLSGSPGSLRTISTFIYAYAGQFRRELLRNDGVPRSRQGESKDATSALARPSPYPSSHLFDKLFAQGEADSGATDIQFLPGNAAFVEVPEIAITLGRHAIAAVHDR